MGAMDLKEPELLTEVELHHHSSATTELVNVTVSTIHTFHAYSKVTSDVAPQLVGGTCADEVDFNLKKPELIDIGCSYSRLCVAKSDVNVDLFVRSPKIILGSSSMARRQILTEMGYEFTIMTADIDEKAIRKEKPEELVMALAQAKADAILSKLQIMDYLEKDMPPTLLITADTVVVYKGIIREKPSNEEEAREFIRGYSGSHAAVVGSVLVTNLKTGTRKGGWERAEVQFKIRGVEMSHHIGNLDLDFKDCLVYFYDIPDEVIDNMIEEEICLNVAGGLMLEHPLTLPFVEAVVGSTDCVMGLSKALTESLIQEALL